MMPARRVARRTSRRTSAEKAMQDAAADREPQPLRRLPRPPRRTTWRRSSSSPTMKDQGVLTEEEFQAKKKQILGI